LLPAHHPEDRGQDYDRTLFNRDSGESTCIGGEAPSLSGCGRQSFAFDPENGSGQ